MIRSEYQKTISEKLIKLAKRKFGDENIVMVVPKFMAKSFHSYCSMKEDLDLILRQLDYLEEQKYPKDIDASLTYSIITLYGKCFTDATSGKAPKLEANKIITEKKSIKTHDYLMNLRHNFLAHRGETDSEIEAAFFLISKGSDTTSQVQFMRVKQTGFPPEKIEELRKHVTFIKSEVMTKIEKSAKKVQKGMLNLDKKIVKWTIINGVEM